MVVVEQVVEEKWQEQSCIGASTHIEVHSNEVGTKHENKTNEQQVEDGIDMNMTKEGVQTNKDEQGDPKKVCEWIGWGCNKFWMPLASPTSTVWMHVAFFGLGSIAVQWLLQSLGTQL